MRVCLVGEAQVRTVYGIARIATNLQRVTRWVDADRPSPAICGQIQSLGRNSEIELGYYAAPPPMTESSKPPYRVPSMAEIDALPWNGFNAISTFSGCGGSCLGYRMAGFRVLWASEFVPAAQETYRANSPSTILDTRDIRDVAPFDILSACGKGVGEIDLMDGSPPCASFSTAGKREAGWGQVKNYSDTKQRTDDLFFEFARLVKGVQPRVFVAENVSGLVKGTAKGYFLEILAALKACGYRVQARLLDAQWLGVPQARQRIIFVGVREDLGIDPVHPRPLGYRYSVRDALYRVRESIEPECDIAKYAIGKAWESTPFGGKGNEKYYSLKRPKIDDPCLAITCPPSADFSRTAVTSAASVCHPTEKRKFSIAELRRICGFPDDFVLNGSYSQNWERLGRAVPPVMMSHVARTVRDEILCKIKRP